MHLVHDSVLALEVGCCVVVALVSGGDKREEVLTVVQQ